MRALPLLVCYALQIVIRVSAPVITRGRDSRIAGRPRNGPVWPHAPTLATATVTDCHEMALCASLAAPSLALRASLRCGLPATVQRRQTAVIRYLPNAARRKPPAGGADGMLGEIAHAQTWGCLLPAEPGSERYTSMCDCSSTGKETRVKLIAGRQGVDRSAIKVAICSFILVRVMVS